MNHIAHMDERGKATVCDCGLGRSHDGPPLTTTNVLADAVVLITREFVGNEVRIELPGSLRSLIAQCMVDDPVMGWPDVEVAEATLDDWRWT